MTIYWSHITGVKVLVIAERGLLLVIMIASDVGGRGHRERERWKTRATSKPVPAISGRDHHTITQHQLKTLPFSCPFMQHFSASDANSISAQSKYVHCLGCSSLAESYTCFKYIILLNRWSFIIISASLLIFQLHKYFGTIEIHLPQHMQPMHIAIKPLFSEFQAC